MSTSRTPAVAGRFYPDNPQILTADLKRYCPPHPAPKEARAIIVPHAGYPYSGACAGAVFSRTIISSPLVVLGPNHTGLGHPIALTARGHWATPLGPLPIDAELADALLRHLPNARDDHRAHLREHSIEVLLPFILHRQPQASFVPLCLAHLTLEQCRALGADLAQCLKDAPTPPLLVVSTDMSHFLSATEAAARDAFAIDAMVALDPERLYAEVHHKDITMCGVIPTTVALFAALDLGASAGELIAYTHSGTVSGDHQRVVAYAGVVVS